MLPISHIYHPHVDYTEVKKQEVFAPSSVHFIWKTWDMKQVSVEILHDYIAEELEHVLGHVLK
jgi:hypothetical protein